MRGLRSSCLHKKPNSCRALLNLIECWLIMSHLDEVMQAGTRSSVVSNSVTCFSNRWEVFVLHPSTKGSRQLSSTFCVHWVMTDHIMFRRGNTGCSQVISCKQLGDFFLDRWEVFVLHPCTKKPWQLSSTFEFYCLMTDDVSFGWPHTSYSQVFSCKQFGDIDWLNACQAAKVIHKR